MAVISGLFIDLLNQTGNACQAEAPWDDNGEDIFWVLVLFGDEYP